MVAPNRPGTDANAAQPADQALAQAQAERDEALAKLAKVQRTRVRGGMIRRTIVGILVFLIALLVPVTAATAWVRHTVLNTNNYVSTVAPIASNPAVTEAVARTATDQLFVALDPQQIVANALPPKASFLAAPITNGIKGFVQSQVNNILATAAFQQIWITANRVAHEALLKILNGQAKALQTTNGEVVLNLVPLLNNVLAAVQKQASELIGKNVTLPTLSGNELPSAACAKISAALHRPLPATCGQIPLFPAGKLDQAQHAVRLFKHLVVALLIITPLLALLALWLSRRRRRTLMQMAVGVMLGMVLVRRTVFWLQDTLIATGKPENTAARGAIVHQVLHGFFDMSLWVLWIALAVLVIAAVTGPYRWAVAGRHWLAGAGRNVVQWTRVGFGRAKAGGAGGWIPAHLDLLRIGGAALALVLILAFSLSFVGVLIVLGLTAAYEFWLYRIREQLGPPGAGAGASA
ncbi:MAG TPA: hypothetical protein VIG48_08460 [Jatrophihabitans sp.]